MFCLSNKKQNNTHNELSKVIETDSLTKIRFTIADIRRCILHKTVSIFHYIIHINVQNTLLQTGNAPNKCTSTVFVSLSIQFIFMLPSKWYKKASLTQFRRVSETGNIKVIKRLYANQKRKKEAKKKQEKMNPLKGKRVVTTWFVCMVVTHKSAPILDSLAANLYKQIKSKKKNEKQFTIHPQSYFQCTNNNNNNG